MRFGVWEIALILVIVLIIFGVGKLPQIGGAFGKSLREFRRAQKGEDEEQPEKVASEVRKTETSKSVPLVAPGTGSNGHLS